tara:strand:+ start:1312 stop:1779 length:468 start_codon:yes stop_codon:yes gene_type:complete
MNYRKLYENYYNLKIPFNWEIHHIDANRENNDIKNLIMLPKQLHRALHNYVGLLPKKELKQIRLWFKKIKSPISNTYLGYKLKKQVAKLNLSKNIINENKKYIENKNKIYDNYLLKFKVKTNLSDWVPDSKIINYDNVLYNESKSNAYNELNEML